MAPPSPPADSVSTLDACFGANLTAWTAWRIGDQAPDSAESRGNRMQFSKMVGEFYRSCAWTGIQFALRIASVLNKLRIVTSA